MKDLGSICKDDRLCIFRKIYSNVLKRNVVVITWKTIQVIPHVTDEIKDFIKLERMKLILCSAK